MAAPKARPLTPGRKVGCLEAPVLSSFSPTPNPQLACRSPGQKRSSAPQSGHGKNLQHHAIFYLVGEQSVAFESCACRGAGDNYTILAPIPPFANEVIPRLLRMRTMTQPFSGIPDPGSPRWSRRSLRQGALGDALQRARREARRYSQDLGRYSKDLGRYSKDLWQRGKRNPRMLALIGGAVTLTLVSAYTLNASGVGPSLCPVPRQLSSANSPTTCSRKSSNNRRQSRPPCAAACTSALAVRSTPTCR